MNTQTLVESTWGTARLSAAQAELLSDLGRRLASDRSWWGSDPDEQQATGTVIRCERVAGEEHRVRVADAIGVIGLDDTQLVVEPKIPLDHLIFLLEQAEQIPRLADRPTRLRDDESFQDLIARWFIGSTERLLRRGLLSDYSTETDDLLAVRGKIQLLPTTRAFLTGRPRVRCEFDEFGNDTALNRILHTAAGLLAHATPLDTDLRQRARRVRSRIGPVSPLRPHDLRIRPDRRSAYYGDAIALARCVISGHGRTLTGGDETARTFLFRTPEPVEEGIRRVLASGLDELCRVHKTGLVLDGSRRRTLNPDLVFGDTDAIGDIKYTRLDRGLKRSHLYQLTTFATGYRTYRALLIGFSETAIADHAIVGDVRLDTLTWTTDAPDPESAASDLIARVQHWYTRPPEVRPDFLAEASSRRLSVGS